MSCGRRGESRAVGCSSTSSRLPSAPPTRPPTRPTRPPRQLLVRRACQPARSPASESLPAARSAPDHPSTLLSLSLCSLCSLSLCSLLSLLSLLSESLPAYQPASLPLLHSASPPLGSDQTSPQPSFCRAWPSEGSVPRAPCPDPDPDPNPIPDPDLNPNPNPSPNPNPCPASQVCVAAAQRRHVGRRDAAHHRLRLLPLLAAVLRRRPGEP